MTTGDSSPIKSHDHVLVQLDTGDIVEASVVSIRREERRTGRVSKRKKSWSRWAGKPEHVVDIARTVVAEIQRKTGEAPAITIGVQFKQDEDEEYYFDLDSFDNDLRAAEQGSRSISLGHITQIGMTFGPTTSGQMTANLLLSGQAPAVRMEIEGTDKVDVIGIRDHVATVIAPGRRRPPAPNMLAYYIIGGTRSDRFWILANRLLRGLCRVPNILSWLVSSSVWIYQLAECTTPTICSCPTRPEVNH